MVPGKETLHGVRRVDSTCPMHRGDQFASPGDHLGLDGWQCLQWIFLIPGPGEANLKSTDFRGLTVGCQPKTRDSAAHIEAKIERSIYSQPQLIEVPWLYCREVTQPVFVGFVPYKLGILDLHQNFISDPIHWSVGGTYC